MKQCTVCNRNEYQVTTFLSEHQLEYHSNRWEKTTCPVCLDGGAVDEATEKVSQQQNYLTLMFNIFVIPERSMAATVVLDEELFIDE